MNFQEFRFKYEKTSVQEYPNCVPNKPLVSVSVVTYQHKNFIKYCLDGIVMQKTNFPFEILLGEDASTDGTREICIEYAERYPNLIRLILHDRSNNILIDGKPTGRFNMLYNLFICRGKYIALCEGDDYWTDPYKLQKQFDILESDFSCSLCAHPFRNYFKNSNDYGPIQLNRFMTLTMMFKNSLPLRDNRFLSLMQMAPHGDSVIREIMKRKGYLKFIPYIAPAIRIVHDSGRASSLSKEKRLSNSIGTHKEIMEYFGDHRAVSYHKGKIALYKLLLLRLQNSRFRYAIKGIYVIYNKITLKQYLRIFYYGE